MPYRLPSVRKVTLQAEAPPEIPYGVQMLGAPLEWVETKGASSKVRTRVSGFEVVRRAGPCSARGCPKGFRSKPSVEAIES